jgi:hypothetical protein
MTAKQKQAPLSSCQRSWNDGEAGTGASVVMPAQAGIQKVSLMPLDSSLRWNDGEAGTDTSVVMPAQAGIQRVSLKSLDSSLRWNDGKTWIVSCQRRLASRGSR